MCNFDWSVVAVAGVFILAVFFAFKKNQAFYKNSSQEYLNKQKEVTSQSLANQQEMINILKEIRDNIKK